MVYKVSVKSETLSWEEPSADDPDMSLRKEETKYTATCFELGLSAESIDWEPSALSELKEKISKKTGIDLKDIEFQITHEDDDWNRKKKTAELNSDDIPNEKSSFGPYKVILEVTKDESEVIWTATCHELELSKEGYGKTEALNFLKHSIAMNKKIPVEKVELLVIDEMVDPL
jgi:hypothetical protein